MNFKKYAQARTRKYEQGGVMGYGFNPEEMNPEEMNFGEMNFGDEDPKPKKRIPKQNVLFDRLFIEAYGKKLFDDLKTHEQRWKYHTEVIPEMIRKAQNSFDLDDDQNYAIAKRSFDNFNIYAFNNLDEDDSAMLDFIRQQQGKTRAGYDGKTLNNEIVKSGKEFRDKVMNDKNSEYYQELSEIFKRDPSFSPFGKGVINRVDLLPTGERIVKQTSPYIRFGNPEAVGYGTTYVPGIGWDKKMTKEDALKEIYSKLGILEVTEAIERDLQRYNNTSKEKKKYAIQKILDKINNTPKYLVTKEMRKKVMDEYYKHFPEPQKRFGGFIPKYSNGGIVRNYSKGGVVEGMPHEMGGVPTFDKEGNEIAEVEGGEQIFSVADTEMIQEIVSRILNARSQEEADKLAIQLGYFIVDANQRQQEAEMEEQMAGDEEEDEEMEEQMAMKAMAKYGKNKLDKKLIAKINAMNNL
jgi:hypothetical protein